MARKNEIKNDSNKISFNTRTGTVMANVAQDNIKEKVNAVREVVSGKSNDEIVLVLQYYDNDVERVIQSYLEDGAKEALTEWHYSGTKPVKKKKNKKKNQTTQLPNAIPQSPVSVSSESGSATSLLVNGYAKEHMVNGITEVNGTDVQSTKAIPNGRVSPVLSTNDVKITGKPVKSPSMDTEIPHPHVVPETSTQPSTIKVKVRENKVKEKSPSPLQQRQHHDNKRHRTHSGSHTSTDHRNRTSSTSSTGADGKTGKKGSLHVLERSSKDLHRQTVSLDRLRMVFNDEVDKSYKRIKSVFDELRNCLNKREAEMMEEMSSVKDMGRDTFNMRQGKAADLKVKIDRSERMNETELAELRNEIKSFVKDRKIDEDLGRTMRFLYADDKLKSDIATFGEVTAVHGIYVQRHPSLSSIDSDHGPPESDPIPPVLHTNTAKVDQKKPDTAHLDAAQTHEVAELQRRLKHSLTLGGIKVETYPERPVSMPLPESNTTATESAASNNDRPTTGGARNNRNRRRGGGRGAGPANNQDRRERPGTGGPNRGFIQGADGERIILIGKGTRPQSGPGRPPRGGGAAGGGRGSVAPRGRGGNREGRGRGGQRGARSPSSGDTKNNNNPEQTQTENKGKDERSSNPRPNTGNRNQRTGSPRKPANTNSPRQRQAGGGAASKPAGLDKQKEGTAPVTINE